jgi:lipopolysaccharide assembly protein A
MRLYFTIFLFLILLAVAFIFGSQNDQIMTLNYLIAKTQISVAAAVGLFTAIGFVLGLLFVMFWKLLSMIKPTKNDQLITGKKP